MPDILDLSAIKDGSIISNAVVYISSYKRVLKKDGKSGYISGFFANKKDTIGFKVWDAPVVDYLTQNDMQGRVVRINGKANSYMNNVELNVTSITPLDEAEYSRSLFLKSADVDGLFKEFTDFVNTNLTQKGVQLVLGIFKGDKLFERFKEEFAGSRMHDAQVGGLLHHTLKMLKIAKTVVENEPRFGTIENFADLLFVSIIMHDIGKIDEMHFGVYQENSFVSHRILGIERLVKYKTGIIQLYDANFYYELISVLQGHHGEFADKPTTVMAYIVHLIDMLESQTTGIFDKIENNDFTMRAGSMAVVVNDSYLTV